MLTSEVTFWPQQEEEQVSGTTQTMGQNEFLQLLVTQMQNQDPLDPLRNEEFIAQLAQFSALEQMVNMNSTLATLTMLESSINNSQAVNLIGKRISVEGDGFKISGGQAPPMAFSLEEAAKSVTVKVVDSSGEAVRSIELGNYEAGRHDFVFDGCDDAGNALADGEYTLQVVATGEEGESLGVTKYMEVQVEGVTFADGIVYVIAGGQRYCLNDITEVRGD
jgi:flagellar basal-body rod modification protein FlgD